MKIVEFPTPTKKRPTNKRYAVGRKYLRESEVMDLVKAAKGNRYGHRDATLLEVMYRHALRVSEAVGLRWDQVDMDAALLDVRRLKGGIDSVHPIPGGELRALRRLRRMNPDGSPFLFLSERGGPLSRRAVNDMMARLGKKLGWSFRPHPHMLRHATGHSLVNRGTDTRSLQHYMGHRSIVHTTRYTELDHQRFKDLWR
jgi:type 1 fimbriae regulatory protein FimB/type 1 fimbriae regulatory protein FimE